MHISKVSADWTIGWTILAFAFQEVFACNEFLFPSCFIFWIACVSGVGNTLQQNWAWELMCSLDGYKMFASILVLLSAISADESWKIFHLGCCIFSWLRSSLWLQFKPHHIAAGAAYLAAKILNLDVASYQYIWQEFQTTPAILQDVAQQLMELF